MGISSCKCTYKDARMPSTYACKYVHILWHNKFSLSIILFKLSVSRLCLELKEVYNKIRRNYKQFMFYSWLIFLSMCEDDVQFCVYQILGTFLSLLSYVSVILQLTVFRWIFLWEIALHLESLMTAGSLFPGVFTFKCFLHEARN